MAGRPPFVYQNSIDFVIDVLKSSKDDVWLLAHSSMEKLAERIVERCSSFDPQTKHFYNQMHQSDSTSSISSQQSRHGYSSSQSTRGVIWLKIINWGHFPDGFPNLFIEEIKEMAGKDVIFLASFDSPGVIFEQLSVLYAIPRYLARSFHVILPYFPTGTMERIDTEGQIATAKTLATLLSAIPLTARGPTQIVIFDIHALQERFYFSENVIPRLTSAIPLIKRELDRIGHSDLAVAFPDDGATKRFQNFFPGDVIITCNKIRDGEQRLVKLKGGDPTGKHVVIIDDLVQTGGTLIECAKALLNYGARAVSAYVTHAVFPNKAFERFAEGNNNCNFENFWITDSVPHAYEICQHPPFKMLSLSDVIADTLWGYDLTQY